MCGCCVDRNVEGCGMRPLLCCMGHISITPSGVQLDSSVQFPQMLAFSARSPGRSGCWGSFWPHASSVVVRRSSTARAKW